MPRGDIPNFEHLSPDARARVERSEADPAFARGYQTAQLEFMLASSRECKAQRVDREDELENTDEELAAEVKVLQSARWKLIGILSFLGFAIPILVTIALELWFKA